MAGAAGGRDFSGGENIFTLTLGAIGFVLIAPAAITIVTTVYAVALPLSYLQDKLMGDLPAEEKKNTDEPY